VTRQSLSDDKGHDETPDDFWDEDTEAHVLGFVTQMHNELVRMGTQIKCDVSTAHSAIETLERLRGVCEAIQCHSDQLAALSKYVRQDRYKRKRERRQTLK
jgi:hypothetical protein